MENIYEEKKKKILNNLLVQYKKFPYYGNMCKENSISVKDLEKMVKNEDFNQIPAVSSLAFKLSKGLTKDLNDMTMEGCFQVSSSTSGDPSYVYTTERELNQIRKNYGETFSVDGVKTGIILAPDLKLMQSLSNKTPKKYEKNNIIRMQLALEGSYSHYEKVIPTVELNLMKTIFSMIFKRKPVLKKMSLADFLSKIKNITDKNESILLGGFVLFLTPYLEDIKGKVLDSQNKLFIVLSGGGYSGKKGTMKGIEINKKTYFLSAAEKFGVDDISNCFRDIYAFTESAGTHLGYFDPEVGDFVFQTWKDSIAYAVDPETKEPLKKGEIGLFKVFNGYVDNEPSAANVVVEQQDLVEVLKTNDNGTLELFRVVGRYGNSSTEGCALKADEMVNQ